MNEKQIRKLEAMKAESLINDDQFDRLMRAKAQLAAYSANDAINALFAIVSKNRYFSEDLEKLDLEGIPEKALNVFVRDARKAMEVANETLKIDDDAQKALKKACQSFCDKAYGLGTVDEGTIFLKLMRKCEIARNIMDEEEISRMLFLLRSDKVSNAFGGMCSLGFTKEEVAFLQPEGSDLKLNHAVAEYIQSCIDKRPKTNMEIAMKAAGVNPNDYPSQPPMVESNATDTSTTMVDTTVAEEKTVDMRIEKLSNDDYKLLCYLKADIKALARAVGVSEETILAWVKQV